MSKRRGLKNTRASPKSITGNVNTTDWIIFGVILISSIAAGIVFAQGLIIPLISIGFGITYILVKIGYGIEMKPIMRLFGEFKTHLISGKLMTSNDTENKNRK